MTEFTPTLSRSAGCPIPFTDAELFAAGPQPTYSGPHLDQIAFPLGGIGAGCVSMGGRGELTDWEIFNRPNKGYRPAFTFFTLFARPEGGEPIFRVLEGRLPPHYQGPLPRHKTYAGFGFGPPVEHGAGFLRMAECSFTSEFPFSSVDLADPNVPVRVSTSAWSPFIPLNDADSSLPVAVFDVTLTNDTDIVVDATVALGLQNIVGYPETGGALNAWMEDDETRGILMSTQKHPPASVNTGSLALLTPNADVTWQLRFAETAWFAASESLLDEFGATGEFSGPREPAISGPDAGDIAQLGLKVRLAPGESVVRTFVLAWLTPNAVKYWGLHSGTGSQHDPSAPLGWPTYQGLRWENAAAVARYVIQNLTRLRAESRQFANAFFSSTLPTHVLDAISSQMATLRTPSMTRLPDGTIWGWEGCMSDVGCCEGTCTHVWAYAQTMAHLFPKLERDIRAMEFNVDVRADDGHMQFRMPLPPGTQANHLFHAAVDGQMACVIRTYREWQISGDEPWLRAMWPTAKAALEYAWREWDADRDGLLEGVHHNTLDIEFHGPDTMCGSMYLAALRAGEEMARYLGDDPSADAYRRVFDSGRAGSDAQLYNGEYYFQPLPEGVTPPPYQFGPGCMADQVLGQWHARMLGLGDLYDAEHIRSAVAAIFRHNFRDNLYNHQNPHRVFAINDEKALLICTWPRGGRPKSSVTYAFECFTGVEYQVAAHLIYEGYLREGLAVCKAVRDRHDGVRRNPFNEFECGSHYVRALANYSLLLALSNFRYAAPERALYFDPVISADDFRCFFSTDSGWGVISQQRDGDKITVRIELSSGNLEVERAVIGGRAVFGAAIHRMEDGGYEISV